LWSFYLADKILEYIADETNRYGNGTWVCKISRKEWRQLAAGDGNDGDVTASTRSRKKSVHANMSAMESGGNVSAGANVPWFFRVPDQMPEDKESLNNNSDSSDSEYDPHENHPHNCDLSAPGSDADSDFDEEGSDYNNTYIPEEVDPELCERLYVREPKERDCLVECDSNHPNRRKRYQIKGMEWVPVTVGYLTAWFGILILMSAQGVRFWKIPWMKDTGLNIPFIQNTMPVHRFDQIRRYLHFVDNKKLVPKGWNPLQKIHPFMIKMLV
jgi:hypothetical protein